MAEHELPEPYQALDALIEAGDFEAAQAACTTAGPGDVLELLQIKLSIRDGSVEPPIGMQRLVALMRKNADIPGAREFYKEVSRLAYETRQSSMAHSHPPPPVEPD